MKCPECQTEVSGDSKFCSECGASLAVDLGSLSPTRTILGPAFQLKKGQKIAGKYKIIQKIGEGGMGIVYKAEDTKLDRPVALKFLPFEMTRDPLSRKRFIQEAKAAAALNHPNICIIHEVDESDDQTFIAMEFIDGQTLKDKIEAGPLAVDEAIDIASHVAEGLGEAHKKGIVHRDIKPANIMLTAKGQAKIMDFGLAKLSWGADLTKPSMIMGTVAYMSPEQARGEPVDHRTDIWSLGAMLYEMLTGEKPFKKNQDQALIYAILNEKPTPLSIHRSAIASHIELAINKSLAKKASERYQHIDELINDLKASPPISFPKAEKSIVVLPFENLSPDPDQEYFCDGMTEEIISDLSQVDELGVISRTSAMILKGTKKKVKDIARELDVQYVLEGSVRKAGNSLRIAAQLIDAGSDKHIWADKYTGTLDDVFDIQEKVSLSIVAALKLKLEPDKKRGKPEQPIGNVKAYEYYLRAKHENALFAAASAERALQYLQRAQELEGDNILIFEGMAESYFILSHTKVGEEEKSFEKYKEYVNKISELGLESSYGYLHLGLLRVKDLKLNEGVKLLKRAVDIDPNNTETLKWLSFAASEVGMPSIAEPCSRKLLEINPLDAWSHFSNGWFHLMGGRFKQALKAFKKAHQMAPESPAWAFKYARTLVINHQLEEAYSIFELTIRNAPEDPWACIGKLYQHALQGEKHKVTALVTEGLESAVRWDETESWYLAGVYALIDEKEASIDWLENAVRRGFLNYPCLNEYDPFLENIRGEPRFKKLMERVKHEWENFEV